MQEIFDFLKDLAIQRSSTFILTSEIERINRNGRKNQVVLALAESMIFIAGRKGLLKKIKITHSFSLLDVHSIEFLSKTEATIKFEKDELHFSSYDCVNIITQIAYQTHRLLTDEEFSMISVPQKIKNFPKSSPQSFLYRLQVQFSELGDPIDISEIQDLQTDIFYGNDTFDFNNLPKREDVMEIFFNALCLRSGFKQITFQDRYEFDLFDFLSKYYHFNSRIKNIIFKSDVTHYFPNFIEKLSQSKNPRLCSISFVKSKLSEAELACMFYAVQEGKLTSLSFNQSLTPELLMDITSHECFFNLRALNLKRINGINIEQLSKFLLNLHSFSIVDCGVTVSEVVNAFAKYPVANIKYLNVSEQKCGQPIRALPPRLVHIVADKVDWTESALTAFLSVCASHQLPIKVSVANAKIDNNAMEQSISSLSGLGTCMFSAIVWNNNIINTNFVLFLKKSRFLTYVSLCGCTSKIFVGDICMLLDSNTTIETLRVQGSKKALIGDITPLCDMLPLCSSLRELDISCQNISNAEIKYLAEKLLRCKKIEAVAFHGTNATSATPFIDFAATIYNANKRLNIVWPYDDIVRLSNSGSIAEDEENEMLARFQACGQKEQPKNPFDKPYSVYCDKMNVEFPKYLTHKQLRGEEHYSAYEIGKDGVVKIQEVKASAMKVQPQITPIKLPQAQRAPSSDFRPPSIAKSRENFNKTYQKKAQEPEDDEEEEEEYISPPKQEAKGSKHLSAKANAPGGNWNFNDDDIGEEEEIYIPPVQKNSSPVQPIKRKKQKRRATEYDEEESEEERKPAKKQTKKQKRQVIEDDEEESEEESTAAKKRSRRQRKQAVEEEEESSEEQAPVKKQTKKKEEKEQKKPIVIKRTKKIRPVRQDTEQQNEDSEDEKPAQAPKPQKKQKQKQKSNPVEIAVDWDEPMQLPPEPDNSDFIHNNAQEYSLYKLIKSLTL